MTSFTRCLGTKCKGCIGTRHRRKRDGELTSASRRGKLVRPERFELPTCCFGGNRSIQLSYGRTVSSVYMARGKGGNLAR